MSKLGLLGCVRCSVVVMGIATAGAPAVAQPFTVTPRTLAFGEVSVGEIVFRELTVTNTGAATVNVQSVTPEGSPAFRFQIPGSFPIGPGQFWVLQVAFQPPTVGLFEGAVHVRIAGAAPTVVRLTGAGVASEPRIRVRPRRLDFGEVTVGSEADRTLTISNRGDAVLRVRRIASDSAAFSIGPTGGLQVQPGQSAAVDVTFQPLSGGLQTGVVSIRNNDSDNGIVQVPVQGLGVEELPPPVEGPFDVDFEAEIVPGRLRVSPGATVPVTIRLRNLGSEALRIRSTSSSAVLPDGSVVELGAHRFGAVFVPAGATVETPGAVVLPEAFYEALGSTVDTPRFVQSFVGDSAGASVEREAEALLIPVGSLGAELSVHTASVDFPLAGSSFVEGALVRARAQVFGRGIGSVVGRWLVDGLPFETMTVDLEGRAGVVTTLGTLPTNILGRHSVELEILEPSVLRTPPVTYVVTPRDDEGLRWLDPPGAGTYLVEGRPPELVWTPRAGAIYHLEINGRAVASSRFPGWRATAETWLGLGGGDLHITVRAVVGDEETPLFEERLERRLVVLDRPQALDSRCEAGECSWTPAQGGSLYAIEWLSEDDVVYRRITAGTSLERSSLVLPDQEPLSWRVRAVNDHGETVGESETSLWQDEGPR